MISLGIGCANSGPDDANEYLIRIGDRVLTVLEFNEAFELVKTAYPHDIRNNNEDLKSAQLRLLNQMTVEMIILERADELGIEISQTEIDQAVSEIRNDYPEDAFEETLIEFALSYETWENRLKSRLLIDKVIEKELKDQIVITPEDISLYYQEKYEGQDLSSVENSEEINEAIIKNLRRKKAEEAYLSWIEHLKANYKIDINSEQWQKITGTKDPVEKDLEDDTSENS
jgi:hypothetical protein